MKSTCTIHHGHYTDVKYRQFQAGQAFHLARMVLGVLMWPVVWPLAMLGHVSDDLFRTVSEFLSLVPYLIGVIVRTEFYRFALRRCGRNVVVEFGTILLYSDVSIGDNVLIGRYNTFHHCDFGSYGLTAEGCTFLSGSKYHNFDRTDMPIALQGGKRK